MLVKLSEQKNLIVCDDIFVVEWYFWSYFIFRFRLSLLIFFPLLSFSYSIHCIYVFVYSTRAQPKKQPTTTTTTIPKIEIKEDTKKAFSNFIYRCRKKMHYEIENSLYFCLWCFCSYPRIHILGYNVNWYRNKYEVCCVVLYYAAVMCEPPQIGYREILTAIIVIIIMKKKHQWEWYFSIVVVFILLFLFFKSQIGWTLAMGNVILCHDVEEVKFNSPWFCCCCCLNSPSFVRSIVGMFVDFILLLTNFITSCKESETLGFLAVYAKL